ncbi:MAG: dihydrofolate reductase [Acidobacteriota bacterium]
MKLSIIAAIASNGVIGRGNDLPWHLSEDLKRFKRLTMGHHLIMGRKTFESIGRPLPGRFMIVISRQERPLPEGVQLADSLEAAVGMASDQGEDEAFVAGGAEIYALALPKADRLYLTRIEAAFDGDTWFPEMDPGDWSKLEEEHHGASSSFAWPYTFQLFERHSKTDLRLSPAASSGTDVE